MNEIALKCPYKEDNCDLTKCGCAKYLAYTDAKDPEKVSSELAEMGFDMDSMSGFELLMAMQKSFEERFHKNGVDNLTDEEKQVWINKYLVCIEDEVREFREHLSIYPGSKHKDNLSELKKELIDILHFMMDAFICGGATYKDIVNSYLKIYHPHITDVRDLIEFSWMDSRENIFDEYEKYEINMGSLVLSSKLLDCNGSVRQCITWKHWKKPLETLDHEKLYLAFAEMFKAFMDLCTYNHMWNNEIIDIYISKNLENRFRQHRNY